MTFGPFDTPTLAAYCATAAALVRAQVAMLRLVLGARLAAAERR